MCVHNEVSSAMLKETFPFAPAPSYVLAKSAQSRRLMQNQCSKLTDGPHRFQLFHCRRLFPSMNSSVHVQVWYFVTDCLMLICSFRKI